MADRTTVIAVLRGARATLLAATLCAAGAARADALVDAARAAVQGERWCEARDLYMDLFARDGEAKYLYNAAESAGAADDRISALDLYRRLLERAPGFDRAAKARERVTELGALIASSGSGATCPARASLAPAPTPPPTPAPTPIPVDPRPPSAPTAYPPPPNCGDTHLDADEMCDDGNLLSGDGCDANCTPSVCGNGIVTEPEMCDDGNLKDGDGCTALCLTPGAQAGGATTSGGGGIAPLVVTGASAAVLVGGVVLAGIGGAGFLDLEARRTALDAAATAAAESPDDVTLLQNAVESRTAAETARAAWNGTGQLLWISGVAMGVVGAGGVAAGLSWWALAE